MAPGSKGNSTGLSRRYSAALRKQLGRKSDARSRPAESLGHEALSAGLGVLDLVRIHERALIALPPPARSPKGDDGTTTRALSFLLGALKPIANAHRTALKRNGRLDRRTGELASTRRRLAREIGRRKRVQEALKTSERHYGQLLEKSRRMQEHLRRLSHEILSAHEEERKRISRELHDQIGQTLTAISVKLATLRKQATVDTTVLTRRIASTQRLVERSMNTVHRFARELRPALLDDLGLIPALHSHMKEFTKRTHIRVHFRASAAIEQLAGDKRTVLYRVAQEAFANVAKHAQASLVSVRIRSVKSHVLMEVHDNGRSFDVNRVLAAKRIRRLGVLGMRERVEMVGGSFSIESAPGRGTTVRAQIPFDRGRV